MANERLRSGIAAAGQTIGGLADAVGVDPKTVERWISSGRIPHRTHRWKTADALGKDEVYLWPALADDKRAQSASEAEFVKIYPHRGSVPYELWSSLIESAVDRLDILVYAGLFLPDNNPDMAQTLTRKAVDDGTKIRLLLGDPMGEAVTRRGEEEQIGEGMAERIRITLNHLAPAIGADEGIELRFHNTTLYNSIFRSDGTMLVNCHMYGTGAGYNPVLHLQRVAGGRMFDQYQESFEKVWATGEVIPDAATANRRTRRTVT